MNARIAHVRVLLAAGESRAHVPAHFDCILGAARPSSTLDGGGRLDNALGGRGRFRAQSVFHARRSMLRIGQQSAGYSDLEEDLGLSRSYLIETVDADTARRAVDALRAMHVVAAAGLELFARSYRVPRHGSTPGAPTGEDADRPFRMVDAATALALEPGREDVLVGVVDTGVALEHPELRGRTVQGYDFVELGVGLGSGGPVLLGDSSGRDDLPEDEVGHGTHIAGVIGAAGLRLPRGLAGSCRALPIRVLAGARSTSSSRPFGIGSLSDIDAGIKYAIDRGAAVLNLSLGTSADQLEPGAATPHAEVCAYAETRDVVLVAASGNEGTDIPFYPAVIPSVLAVGSVGPGGRMSAFTSRGPHVRLFAPGEEVVGLSLHGYRRSTGTSHAAPFVSAAAALMVSAVKRDGAVMPAATVRHVLESTARAHAPDGPPVLDTGAALRAVERMLRTPHAERPYADHPIERTRS